MSLKKVIACLKKNKRFIITAHTNLEGDALGSELAFYRLLRLLGKQAVIINQDDVPYGYRFLPGAEKIKKLSRSNFFSNKSGQKIKNLKFDYFVALDCSDLKRTGEVALLNNLVPRPILNIDHHISNARFGNINWVKPDASSCTEIIYQLYKKLHLPIDKNTALLLYAGIVSDTGSFRYPNTTGLTHKIVADLLKKKIEVNKIYKNIYENIPFSDMKLLSQILPTIKRGYLGRIAWFQLNKSVIRRQLNFDLSEHLLGFARAIKGIEVVVLFKENLGPKNEIRVNFRSQGKIDVNKIARFFNGGGHRTASGATVKGTLKQVRRRVLAKVKEALL